MPLKNRFKACFHFVWNETARDEITMFRPKHSVHKTVAVEEKEDGRKSFQWAVCWFHSCRPQPVVAFFLRCDYSRAFSTLKNLPLWYISRCLPFSRATNRRIGFRIHYASRWIFLFHRSYAAFFRSWLYTISRFFYDRIIAFSLISFHHISDLYTSKPNCVTFIHTYNSILYPNFESLMEFKWNYYHTKMMS